MTGEYQAETLVRQLAQLGRDLQDGVSLLGEYEEEAVAAEGRYRAREYAYNEKMDREFLGAQGSVETRKAAARIATGSYWADSQEAYLEWGRAKAGVRVQNASLTAIRTRIDIGRSLLSREKALLSLSGMGEV
jgi:hypothetical protein